MKKREKQNSSLRGVKMQIEPIACGDDIKRHGNKHFFEKEPTVEGGGKKGEDLLSVAFLL